MSKHFHASFITNKEILSYQLGPRKFSRRLVPHRLSDDQKASRVRDSRALLAILRRLQKIISQAFVAGMSQSFYMSTN
jgi:hypothetical protein